MCLDRDRCCLRRQVVPKKGSISICIPSGSVVKALGSLKGRAGIDFTKARARVSVATYAAARLGYA